MQEQHMKLENSLKEQSNFQLPGEPINDFIKPTDKIYPIPQTRKFTQTAITRIILVVFPALFLLLVTLDYILYPGQTSSGAGGWQIFILIWVVGISFSIIANLIISLYKKNK